MLLSQDRRRFLIQLQHGLPGLGNYSFLLIIQFGVGALHGYPSHTALHGPSTFSRLIG